MTKPGIRPVVALALLLALPALCVAQPEAPVAKPEVKVGDRWTYRNINTASGKTGGRYDIRVVFAERGVIQVVRTQRGKDDEIDMTYTAEWNAVTTLERVFNPHTGWLQFPLQVGATHKASFEVILPKKGRTTRNERQVKVVGWEEVVVPAGKFRALKVISEGHFQRTDGSFISGSARNEIWYVPGVKRWVKMVFENTPVGRGVGEHGGEELMEFKVQ